jgi:hypothetical protein
MEKKTKLTISGSAKKSIKNIEIAKTQSKNAVVIEEDLLDPAQVDQNQLLLLAEVLESNHLLHQNHPL